MDVALFVTCLTDTFFPRVGTAVVRVLRHFGSTVHFPAQQTCCGQPAYNSGFHHEAAALVRRMVRLFPPDLPIVTPSASCATLIRDHGPDLFPDEPDFQAEVRDLGRRTHEFATFLRDRLHVDPAEYIRFAEPVTFHYPCHARGYYQVADLVHWLSGAGNEVRTPERPDLCCGFGGVFAVDFPAVSGNMLADKLAQLVGTGAELVVSNEAACTLQIAGGARRAGHHLRFKHLAECLAESLGLMEAAE